ncbi:HalOD1 output domain-containing protein [Saliphagus sp. GCM10025308]
MQEDHDIGYRIIEAIATREGIDPLDVDPPLHVAIDVGALEDVLRSTNDSTSISFEYGRYTVHLDGPESVQLTPRPECDSSTACGSQSHHSEA